MIRSQQLGVQLGDQFGSRLITSQAGLAPYAQSEGHHHYRAPTVAVQPTTVAEVQSLVRAAAALGLAVVPYGAGTSLEGNAAAVGDSLCIDFSRFNRIVEVVAEDLLCVVAFMRRIKHAFDPAWLFNPSKIFLD